MIPILRNLFLLVLFLISLTTAQITWRVNGESGYFKTSGNEFFTNNDILNRLDGQIRYNYEQQERTASVLLKARPEFYGIKNSFSAIKLKESGSYYHFYENINWGINISAQQHNYSGNNIKINYNVFSFLGDIVFSPSDDPIYTSIGYAYQNTKLDGERNLDIVFLEASTGEKFSSNFSVNYGGYAESFLLKNEYSLQVNLSEEKNKGYRIGPFLNLKYLKEIILNTEYRFLLHNSDITNYPSYEQLIRVIAGKIFFSRLSLFLLLDYYFTHFSMKDNTTQTLLYTPLNSENRYYIKLGYQLADNWELYSKYGYSKENIDVEKYSLAGWSVTLGIEISN